MKFSINGGTEFSDNSKFIPYFFLMYLISSSLEILENRFDTNPGGKRTNLYMPETKNLILLDKNFKSLFKVSFKSRDSSLSMLFLNVNNRI